MSMDFYTFLLLLILGTSLIPLLYIIQGNVHYAIKRNSDHKDKYLDIYAEHGISYKEVKKQLKEIDSDLGVNGVTNKQIINTANNLTKFRKVI